MIVLSPLAFNIVLYQPEIPANTGNIGRLCLGAGANLHIIKPCRFLLDDKSLRRAGLDYWRELNVMLHDDLTSLLESIAPDKFWLCTTKSANSFWQRSYTAGDYFFFGPESRGLPEDLLSQFPERTVTIPMTDKCRSVNLGNSVAVILYEALRQQTACC